KEGTGVAANVLKNLDIDLRKIRLEVDKTVQAVPDMVTMGKLPQTPRAKQVIEYSIEEARNLNHNNVGTEHLLLGLLREQEGVAALVLMNLGLKLEDVRQEVLNLLGHNTGMVAGAAPDYPTPVDSEATQPGTGPTIPPDLTADQLQMIRERIRHLTEQKEVFVAAMDFVLAAKCRDEADALARLLLWYD